MKTTANAKDLVILTGLPSTNFCKIHIYTALVLSNIWLLQIKIKTNRRMLPGCVHRRQAGQRWPSQLGCK